MDLGIAGKVALVTGGARGIGKAVVKEFVAEGAKIGILDIWEEGMQATVEEVRAAGGEAHGVKCDVSDVEQVNAAVKEIAEALGGVDIVVHSAAVLDNIAKIELMDQDRWERDLRVNLTGVFNVTRACLPYMKEKGWGRIVAISSVAGVQGGFGQAGYSSTKAGIIALMKTVALEMGRYGITANAVYPGIVGTEMFQFMREDVKERIRRRSVWRREAEPWEVAKPIVFLCSEPARYITGCAWDLSGGIELFTY